MAKLNINGATVDIAVEDDTPLLWVLREQLGLTGTKYGCGIGRCGACTVLIDGEAVPSCMVTVDSLNATDDIVTIEGLAHDGQLDPVQEAIIEVGGVQCGFCTPGVLISSRALLDRNPNPTDFDIRDALVGNLCRCTGYFRIIEGVKKAAKI